MQCCHSTTQFQQSITNGIPIVPLIAAARNYVTTAQHFTFFFFSSRRRHTRFDCDWSSDVCSSDLNHSSSPSQSNRRVRCPAMNPTRTISSAATKTIRGSRDCCGCTSPLMYPLMRSCRSEEHTSELQSQSNLVCRLLLEKKKHQVIHPAAILIHSDRGRCYQSLLHHLHYVALDMPPGHASSAPRR